MKYEYVLFDLDGTLTDPAIGITNSVIYALEKSGATPPLREALYKFIGPPLVYSFKEYCGFTEEEALRAVGYYRERFSETGLFENEIYPGIRELLSRLSDSGTKIVLATSKPDVYSERILLHFDIRKYFFLCRRKHAFGDPTGKGGRHFVCYRKLRDRPFSCGYGRG